MMPMFLSVFRSSSEQHASEVPITPDTLCRDVVEFCKEPGEGACYLAEAWRSSEEERMMEVLQQWGRHRGEVRYRLRQHPPPPPGGPGAADLVLTRSHVDPGDRSLENGVTSADLSVTLSDLQDLAAWQHQQISSQQQLLASREQQLRSLKAQEQQEVSEQEHLRLLRENAHNQEAKLRRVRALRGRMETKRLSNSKLVEEIQQMSQLFQQKQRELLLAVSRVEELSQQLEALRSSRLEAPPLPPPPPPSCLHSSSTAELEHLCKDLQRTSDLQWRSRGNQEQRSSLSQRSLEEETLERRLLQLRQRLWKKKAALQDQQLVSSVGGAPQGALSRVAAVGPYIQSPSSNPPETLIKAGVSPALSQQEGPLELPPRPLKAASGFLTSQTRWCSGHASTLPRMSSLSSALSGPPPVPSRTRNLVENQFQAQQVGRDVQVLVETRPDPNPVSTKVAPPPRGGRPKPLSPVGTLSPYSTGTFPGKARASQRWAPGTLHSSMLPLPTKQDPPLAAAVRPYTPDLSDPAPMLQRPPTVAASSIYSMYTQQGALGKGQGSLPRRPRVYGKPVLPASGGQHSSDASCCVPDGMEADPSKTGEDAGSSLRPLSPTKLLPFLSNPHRSPCDVDQEALRRRLHHAPRPLKKRGSITEPEGPAGPNIQKLLYQKTTLAAMETVPVDMDRSFREGPPVDDSMAPPPLAPRSPDPAPCHSLLPPLDVREEDGRPCPVLQERPLYPPPPYPSCGDGEPRDDVMDPPPPEVTGQVPPGRKSILRRPGSEPPDRSTRVQFNPLALLLDASLEGEYDLVQRVIYDVDDPSTPNDEGITALHNAVCAGHAQIVHFLVQFGVNANAADSDGWTPLHCAASCNNVQLCKFLVESGAAVFAATHSDMQTAADKCEEMEDGYAQCSQFLYGVQEKMGVMNRGVVYALWDYAPQRDDELAFSQGDCLTVLRREDEVEKEWWWARCGDHEGYVPRNLLGLYLRIKPRQRSLA